MGVRIGYRDVEPGAELVVGIELVELPGFRSGVAGIVLGT